MSIKKKNLIKESDWMKERDPPKKKMPLFLLFIQRNNIFLVK